jgi:hypothetical protein
VLQLPDPEWLIQGLVEQEAFTVLFGEPETAKSFVAFDWALSVASGLPWQGRAVKPGPVVYIVGEGGRGFTKRIKAWLLAHKLQDVPDAHFVKGPVQLLYAHDVQDLLSAVTTLPIKPVLIVVDTLAPCFVGGEENSSKDMGLAVDSVSRIISTTGAAVLLIHHTGRAGGGHVRGSTALPGGADGMILQQRDKKSDVITLTNDKQKDEEKFQPITLKLKQVCLGTDGAGNPVTSCVLETTNAVSTALNLGIGIGGAGALIALQALASCPGGEAHSSAWRAAVNKLQGKTVSPRTFQNWRAHVVNTGLVVGIPGGVHQYRVTSAGLSASASAVP